MGFKTLVFVLAFYLSQQQHVRAMVHDDKADHTIRLTRRYCIDFLDENESYFYFNNVGRTIYHFFKTDSCESFGGIKIIPYNVEPDEICKDEAFVLDNNILKTIPHEATPYELPINETDFGRPVVILEYYLQGLHSTRYTVFDYLSYAKVEKTCLLYTS